MKITFIKPNIGRLEHSLYVDEGRMEPLQLGVLAGLTPPDVECVLYDDRMETIPYDEPTDLVAITVEIYTARRAYEIAAEYRQRGVPVILGGFHPTLAPEECDAARRLHLPRRRRSRCGIRSSTTRGTAGCSRVYRGSARRAAAGRRAAAARSVQGQRLPADHAHAVQPRLPVRLRLLRDQRRSSITATTCARREEVLDEIAAQERKFVFFVDDNFLSNHEAAKLFLRDLIPLRIRWVSQASHRHDQRPGADGPARGERLPRQRHRLRVARPAQHQAACRRRRTCNGRKHATGTTTQRRCEILRDHHLQTWAAFTLGHDHDTVESIRRRTTSRMENKFCFAAYNILMPYPEHAALQAPRARRAAALRRQVVAAPGVSLQPRGVRPART